MSEEDQGHLRVLMYNYDQLLRAGDRGRVDGATYERNRIVKWLQEEGMESVAAAIQSGKHYPPPLPDDYWRNYWRTKHEEDRKFLKQLSKELLKTTRTTLAIAVWCRVSEHTVLQWARNEATGILNRIDRRALIRYLRTHGRQDREILW